MSVVLDVQGLTTGYGSQPVIHDINLHVDAGEVVTLLGANGAGKTTTLLALSGVLPLHTGEVYFDGKLETAPLHNRARRGLCYVTEERSIFKTLSVTDNLKAGGVATEDALALFPELEKRLHVRGGLLSGGEQQMLSLARALCREPRLLLVDEMSLGLAPLIVERLLKAVREAAQTRGCGVLLIEQHARKALIYADRVYVMRRGRIEMDLSASDARARIDEIEDSFLSSRVPEPQA
ncbi:ABC transporter ATP-binding protein [Williamsia muralis]|uniref:ABC transporter ATP-binding protein n=1 Tax=Williamsia marianensis TaxID=85044 RepID=A0A2G3PMR0_WILMA|nr:ABC transporter ATP-binding protein [Williamsia marianensis]PHV67139.1 ABC transporter ATP-binding protein [Williamsia marianensis]